MPDTNGISTNRNVDTTSPFYSPVAEDAIAEAASRCSTWGRWGDDDVLGTMNFPDDAKRVEGASRIRRGAAFSLAQSFDGNGPQRGWRRRNNPVHTMLVSGLDAEFGAPELPHGFGGADDYVVMPLQASTQWDGLGHIFDHGVAYNGRPASKVVTSEGDLLTGIETVADRIAGRGVLFDVAVATSFTQAGSAPIPSTSTEAPRD